MNKHLTPAGIALLYGILAALWIFLSDKLLTLFLPEHALALWINLFTSLVFIAATALLLFLLMRKLLRQATDKDRQLKLFYDLPFIGMAISSPDSKAWLYANERLCDMLGYTRAELQQTTWADITHPDDLDDNIAQFERMKSGEIDGYSLEKRFIRKDGSSINANINVKCTRGVDGKANYIVALVDDITQRKRAELALRKSEATYRSLFDNMLNGVAHYRMIFRDGVPVDYEFIAVNPAFALTTGLKDVIGRKVSEVIPGYAEANPDSLQVFGKVARTGEPTRWEHYLAALDKWFSFSIYSPAPGEFVVVNEDISERKRAEAALRESEDRFRNIFSNAVDGILLADATTKKFVMSNPAIQHMLGYSAEELLQLGVDDIHPEHDLPDVLTKFEQQVNGKITLAPNLPVTRKDGSILYADINAAPIMIGGKSYLMGFFRDITERKQTEDALHQAATVFQYSHNGIIITDLEGNILAANQSFMKHTGYSEAELLGKNPRILHSGRQGKPFA
ncbi:putative diguanylate cyclase YegE [mine drainage metagenome]|uniref:Putative diguanylate cyclase YegE n=1 Tax=mine drainage metagenome TaxID=410659 RepID=A0A1J5U5G2_9ZZZZ